MNYGGLKAVPITGYDKVKDSHIKNKDSKVPLKCNRCGYEFEQSIHGHIKNRNGCKRCAGKLPWTLQLFLAIALTVHEKKYDYSAITEGHIKGVHAMVPVRCRLCDFKWSVSISNHIHNKTGCPQCAGNIPWTRDRFIRVGQEINGDKHDYSELRDEHFQGIHSHVPLRCKTCGCRWSPQIGNYINAESQCPGCTGHLGWNYDRFITESKEIHGTAYNYDLVKPEHVTGYYSKVPLTCNTCHKGWAPTVGHHIHSKSGCPYCCKSRGQRLLAQILETLKDKIGPHIEEAQFPEVKQYYFDFFFYYMDQGCIIEFDGIQHFEDIDMFTKKQSFEYRRSDGQRFKMVDEVKS